MRKYYLLLPFLLCFIIYYHVQAYDGNIEEKWPSPTPWLKDRFTDFLDYMPHQARVVEVGVQGGGYAAFILRNTNPQELYLIDCWEYQDPTIYDDPEANVPNDIQERLYRSTVERFAGDPRVIIIKKYSKDALTMFENESLDWVYIDANHSYDSVKEDIALWWPKVKKGGFLSGHDYIVRESFGVVQAVNEFLNAQGLYFSYMTTENNYDSWAVQKPTD